MWLGVLLGALSLSLSLGSPQGNRAEVSNLIYGGEGPLEKPFPPLVQLFARGQAFCGGTILNPVHILTAAHCVDGKQINQLTVYAGLAYLGDTEDINVQAMTVNRSIIHPSWNNTTLFHDIAILVLNDNIIYTEKIQPIEIIAFDFVTDVKNQNVSIYGFGNTEPSTESKPKRDNEHLYRANTTIVSRADCATAWKNRGVTPPIIFEQICTNATKTGTLPGDSGGPVIYYMENLLTKQIEIRQVGIVSFISYSRDLPDVHTRASTYCTWITIETKLTYSCK